MAKLKKNDIEIHCSAQVAAIFGDALERFAAAAYPEGGSECAQNARYLLQDTARRLRLELGGEGTSRVSRRTRATLRSALTYYYETRFGETGPDSHEFRLVASLLNGASVFDDALEQARQLDASCGTAPGGELAEATRS